MSDMIYRQDVIETVHRSILGFFINSENEEKFLTERDKLLLSINKAICNNIKGLPSAEPMGIPIKWLEEKLTNHPELSYAVTDGIIEVLELWKTSCGTDMRGEEK